MRIYQLPHCIPADTQVVSAFYVVYSIHAAQYFEDLTKAGIVGFKVPELEDGVSQEPSMASKQSYKSKPSIAARSRSVSFIEVAAKSSIIAGHAEQPVLGRASGGVPRLPPPTL